MGEEGGGGGWPLKRDRENATRTRNEFLFPRIQVVTRRKPINRRLRVLFLLPRQRRRPDVDFLRPAGLTRRHLALRLIASKYSVHGARGNV